MQEIIYIRLRKKITIPKAKESVSFHHIASFIGNEEKIAPLKQMTIPISFPSKHITTFILDSFQLVEKIMEYDESLFIQFIGPTEVLIEREKNPKRPSIFILTGIWITLFVGAVMTIMNFHFDVNMQEVHTKIHYLLTGEKVKHPYMIQIPYAIGIGVGMMLFLNESFFPHKRKEPSPIDIEMFRYEQTRKSYLEKQEDDKKGNPTS